jgi:outer membrane protein
MTRPFFPSRRAARAAFAVLALGAAAGRAAAQGAAVRPLTLAEALELASRNAPAVVQAEGQVRAGQASVRAARGAFLPNVSLTGSTTQQSPATARINPQTGELLAGRWATNGGFAAGVTVFDAFQRQFDLRAARAREQAAGADVVQQRAGVSFDVKQQFFAALAADEAFAAARVQRAQADTQLALTRVRVIARTATVADSLQARILVAQAELAEVTAVNDRRSADAALGRLVGSLTPVTARGDLGTGDAEGPLPVDSAALVAFAAAAPQVQQTAAALAAARAGVRARARPTSRRSR